MADESKKTIEEQLKEEQDKLLEEINEKAKKRKMKMNPDADKTQNIDHEFVK